MVFGTPGGVSLRPFIYLFFLRKIFTETTGSKLLVIICQDVLDMSLPRLVQRTSLFRDKLALLTADLTVKVSKRGWEDD